jgi:predicted nucleotidyltransferase
MNNLNPYGLQESDLDALISLLKKNSKIDEIILFGSRAKGTFNNGSDIDLALKGSNLNLQDILDATLETEKLLLPYKLDLIIFNRVKEPSLTDHINRVGIVLYKRGDRPQASGDSGEM